MLPPIAAVSGNNLLQPTSISSNNNNITTTNGASAVPATTPQQATNVGATWSGNLKAGNLNIDLDNLLISKTGKSSAPALSMNALKTQSPAKTQSPLNVQTSNAFGGLAPSPLTSPNLFGSQPQQPQQTFQAQPSAAAFANFNAFQQQPQQQQSSNNNNSSAFDIFQWYLWRQRTFQHHTDARTHTEQRRRSDDVHWLLFVAKLIVKPTAIIPIPPNPPDFPFYIYFVLFSDSMFSYNSNPRRDSTSVLLSERSWEVRRKCNKINK